MKKRLFGLCAVALAVLLALASLLPLSTLASQPTSYSKSSNSGTRNEVCTTLNGTSASSYYTGNYTYEKLSNLSSSSLKSTLNALMSDTHTKTATYNNCRDMANLTDCENNNTANITTLYTSYSTSHDEYNNGQGWNREHVWPKSLGGFETTLAGADMHQIRPAEARTNTQRSNLKYGNVSGGTLATGNLSGLTGGEKTSSYFEPLDNVKGDVARIILYMHVRYYDEYSKCGSVTNVFQSIDVLLEWCALDPVDTWEMGRNEVVQAFQGNRNVFIDYPELAWQLFGKTAPANMTTPSGGSSSGGNSGNGGNEGGDVVDPDTPVITYPTIATIQSSAAGTYTTEGVVVAKNAKSYLLKDDTGVILVYLNSAPSVEIGDKLRISGTTSSYAGAIQFGQSTTHTKLGTETVSYPTPKALNGAECNTYLTNLSLDYVKITGTLSKSGSYYNLAIDGATLTGSITYPADTASLAAFLDQKVEVCAYITGISGSSTKYLNLMMTDIALVISCTHTQTVVKNATSATCKVEGYTGDTYCADCDELLTSGSAIPKSTNHEWDDGVITSASTCTVAGVKTYTCGVCDATKTSALPLDKHYADIVTVKSVLVIDEKWILGDTISDVADGENRYCVITVYYDCTLVIEYGVSSEEDCDVLQIRKNNALLDEISGEISGKTRTVTLKAGDVLKIGYVKDLGGSEGRDEGYFKFLDDIYTELSTTERIATDLLDPTCAEDVTCAICHAVIKSALGHTWDNGTVTLAPTQTAEGIKTYTCGGCGATKTETIEKLPDLSYDYTVNKKGNYCTITSVNEVVNGTVHIPSHINGIPVTRIGMYAFRDCTELTSIVIPEGITHVGHAAFMGCTNLQSVVLPSTLKTIVTYMFADCTALTEIVIPEGVTTIGGSAFRGCTALTSVSIPSTVTAINSNAFRTCRGLTEILIPDTVKTLGHAAFYGCAFLTDVTVGSGIEELPNYAFYNCRNLKNVTLKNGITAIGNYAFSECVMLKRITLPDSITIVGNSAFYNCKRLTDITLSQSLTSIGRMAFFKCEKLSSVVIPASIEKIQLNAFSGCTALSTVYYCGSEDQWNAITIENNVILLRATRHYDYQA